MNWHPFRETTVRIALLFALASTGMVVYEGTGALRPVVVAPAEPVRFAAAEGGAPQRREIPFDRLAALAPFSPTRSAEPERTVSVQSPGALRLVGTVAGGDAPFAVCQLGADRPRLLHVGETLGDWTLQRVAPGSATFIDAARARHELRISPPGN